jgi:DNA-binding LytR/AlgR family response regulator
MNYNLKRFIFNIRDSFLLYASISMGLFLFMLFFQPFSIRFTDLNNVLIFNAGYGLIIFILLYAIYFFSGVFRLTDMEVFSYLNGFILLVLSSVAFTFYLRYVGQASIGFYTVLKIALICLAPPVILRIYRIRHELSLENEILWRENSLLQSRLQDITQDSSQKILEFYSAETATDILRLRISDILMIRSADNYVAIYFRENGVARKKLIRNTLKNIEQLLRSYGQFIRCHRTCIINVEYIDKLHLKISASYVILKELNEHIPVSRQYVIKLKEAAAVRQG